MKSHFYALKTKNLAIILFLLTLCIRLGAGQIAFAPGDIPADLPAVEVVQSFPDAEIPINTPLTIQLPALPHREGHIIVLRLSRSICRKGFG